MVRHTCTPGELDLYDTNGRMNANPRQFPGSEPEFSGTEG